MNVYEIAPPDRDGARRIAQAIYDEIRSAHAGARAFPRRSATPPLDALTMASPATMRRAMLNAFGNARIDNRHEVQAKDIELGERQPEETDRFSELDANAAYTSQKAKSARNSRRKADFFRQKGPYFWISSAIVSENEVMLELTWRIEHQITQ